MTKKKEPNLRAKVEEITPAKAAKWLDATLDKIEEFRNRPISQSVVDGYAQDIIDGNWDTNGETIKLDDVGLVVDGQHRLWAIISADKAVKILVVRGVDRDSFKTIDRGRKRTVGNILSIAGESQTGLLASALNHLHRYLRNELVRGGGRNALSSPEALKLLERHPDIRDSLKAHAWAKPILPGSISVICHYVFSQEKPRMADDFFQRLGEGTELKKTDPVYVLREKLLLRKSGQNRHRLDTLDMLALCFKAWKLRVSSKEISNRGRLFWRRVGSEARDAEDFPYLRRHKLKDTKAATKKSASRKKVAKKVAKKAKKKAKKVAKKKK